MPKNKTTIKFNFNEELVYCEDDREFVFTEQAKIDICEKIFDALFVGMLRRDFDRKANNDKSTDQR